MDTARIEHVKSLIRETFARTKYPGDDVLVAYNEPPRDLLCGKSWPDLVDPKILDAIGDDLALLSMEAFHYYLPGFMIGVLEHYRDIDVITVSVVRSLSPGRYKDPGMRR